MAEQRKRVASFRELVVYQESRKLALDIFEKTKAFPKEETFSLTDQVRRSSRSIGAQIAEAWAKRRYERHFVSKLTDADGELQETQHWIGIAYDCGYWNQETAIALRDHCQKIGRLFGSMIDKADQFCNTNIQSLREFPVEYIATVAPGEANDFEWDGEDGETVVQWGQ